MQHHWTACVFLGQTLLLVPWKLRLSPGELLELIMMSQQAGWIGHTIKSAKVKHIKFLKCHVADVWSTNFATCPIDVKVWNDMHPAKLEILFPSTVWIYLEALLLQR